MRTQVTINKRNKEINCNKTDLIFNSSLENVEVETSITISTENISSNIGNDNNNIQSTNIHPEEIQQTFVTVESYNAFYDDYTQYKPSS